MAPAGLHWCLAPEAGRTADLGADGLARHGLIPELDLPRRMWAGGTIRAPRPIRVGDRVLRRSCVAEPVRKVGRDGPLAFVELSHDYLVGGEIAVRETQTIVYRPAAPAGPAAPRPAPPEPRPGGATLRRIRIDALQLFRFSCLTFNAHRIHVDREFAQQTEGHRDILVHGTLTAALLLDSGLAAREPGKPWRALIRALSPAYCGDLDIRANASAGGLGLEAYSDGACVMRATIEPDAPDGSPAHAGRRAAARPKAAAR